MNSKEYNHKEHKECTRDTMKEYRMGSLAKADCRFEFIIPYLKIGAIHRDKWSKRNE